MSVCSIEVAVKGAYYRQEAAYPVIKRAAKVLKSGGKPDPINIVPEPTCEHDPHALKVIDINSELTIGYVPREVAYAIAMLHLNVISAELTVAFHGSSTGRGNPFAFMRIYFDTEVLPEDFDPYFLAPAGKHMMEDIAYYRYINLFRERHPQYANMTFGLQTQSPSLKDFKTAIKLGINPDGKTEKTLSNAIAKAKIKAAETKGYAKAAKAAGKEPPPPIPPFVEFPEDETYCAGIGGIDVMYRLMRLGGRANVETLNEIQEHKGYDKTDRKRPLTQREAEFVARLLKQQPDMPVLCPRCRGVIRLSDNYCPRCEADLYSMRLPVSIDENGALCLDAENVYVSPRNVEHFDDKSGDDGVSDDYDTGVTNTDAWNGDASRQPQRHQSKLQPRHFQKDDAGDDCGGAFILTLLFIVLGVILFFILRDLLR